MKIHLAWVTPKPGRSKEPEVAALVERYIKRIRAYCDADALEAAREEQLLLQIDRLAGRTQPAIFLLDSRGEMLTSEQFAETIRRARDESVQHIVLAIGPADGWSDEAKRRAAKLISFGAMTLPHELARVVLAEQVYRAFTIIAGHPYHLRH